MEMNHPLWPVVRESARRIVKSEDIIITAPDRFSDLIDELSDKISENIPQRVTFPIHETLNTNEIWVYSTINGIRQVMVYIGVTEPDISACWVEMSIDDGFSAVLHSCFQLLQAGYPGCVGCGGSAQEGRWDELAFRSRVSDRS
ncbi:MAG: hypothetical protein VXZ52_01635 [Candidatus Thermoplasmatota archaeon]|nr:hypothetical protein [Candidatus Thermoplasmatota archaeon]MEC8312584.1 hypothetical protein [Candidatus Thermoplasmatota archaeon]